MTATDITRRFPMMRPDSDYIGLYEAAGGVVFPEKSVEAFCALAEHHGADLHFEEKVLEWEADAGGDGVMVDTALDTYEAGRLVITAGPWAGTVMESMHLPIQAERVVMHWFEPQVSVDHFAPGRFPVHVWQLEDGLDFYGFPALGGSKGGVKLALHNDVRDACAPDSVDRVVYAAEIEAMRRHVRRFFPDMDGRHLTAKTCMYTSSPDDLFIIDRHPDHGQVFFATGFSGHGFKFATVIGEALAELAIDDVTRHPIEPFAMGRFG
jgi:sarcosine oxidase